MKISMPSIFEKSYGSRNSTTQDLPAPVTSRPISIICRQQQNCFRCVVFLCASNSPRDWGRPGAMRRTERRTDEQNVQSIIHVILQSLSTKILFALRSGWCKGNLNLLEPMLWEGPDISSTHFDAISRRNPLLLCSRLDCRSHQLWTRK